MIPRPTKRVSAKERANLRPTTAKGRPKKTGKDREVTALAKKLLNDPWYKRKLIERLRSGSIQPGVESLLYYYAFGKPKETVETNAPLPVKIIFESVEDECPPKPKK